MSPALENRDNIQTHISLVEGVEKANLHDSTENLTKSRDGNAASMRSCVSKYHNEFFEKELCLYSHRVYEAASHVFEMLSGKHAGKDREKNAEVIDNDTSPQSKADAILENASEIEKRLTFELAFSTLKCKLAANSIEDQSLLEYILEDCVFFATHPEADESLVTVMFFDFQNRKFQRRTPLEDEHLHPYLLEIEDRLFACKTKLNASLARNRIKNQAVTIDQLLPEKLRDKDEESRKMPLSGWVNQAKTTIAHVEEQLKSEGFVKLQHTQKFKAISYKIDVHCPNLFIFSPPSRACIPQHEMVTSGLLVLQDKSSCIGPHSIVKLVKPGDDVIHVNAGLGLTSAHIGSLLQKPSKVYAFCSLNEHDYNNALSKLHHLGTTNVKLSQEDFMLITNDDPRLKSAKVVFISAKCSKTAINNPIDFIVNEGEDINILRDLSFGVKDNRQIGRLVSHQTDTLKHALSHIENDIVCEKAIAYANSSHQRKVPYRVVPPVIPLQPSDIERGSCVAGKYINFKATDIHSGTFMAVMAREPEEAKDTAKQILEKAEAKGLLQTGKSKADLIEVPQVVKDQPELQKEPEDILKTVLREYGSSMQAFNSSSQKKLAAKKSKKAKRRQDNEIGAPVGRKSAAHDTSLRGLTASGDATPTSRSRSRDRSNGRRKSMSRASTVSQQRSTDGTDGKQPPEERTERRRQSISRSSSSAPNRRVQRRSSVSRRSTKKQGSASPRPSAQNIDNSMSIETPSHHNALDSSPSPRISGSKQAHHVRIMGGGIDILHASQSSSRSTSATQSLGLYLGTVSSTQVPGLAPATDSATSGSGLHPGTASKTHAPRLHSETVSATHAPGLRSETASATHAPRLRPGTASATHAPGLHPETASATQAPGLHPETASAKHAPGVRSETASATHAPGLHPETASATHAPGLHSETASATHAPGLHPETASATHAPGLHSRTASDTQAPQLYSKTPSATHAPDSYSKTAISIRAPRSADYSRKKQQSRIVARKPNEPTTVPSKRYTQACRLQREIPVRLINFPWPLPKE